jgi:hypothetical protein
VLITTTTVLISRFGGLKVTSWHFPDIKESIDKVDLRRAIMLAAAYEILERLIG